jgi:hypothetical protein
VVLNDLLQLAVCKAGIASEHSSGAPISQLAVGRLLSAVVLNHFLELAVYKAEAAGEHSTAAKHLSVSLP